MQVVLDALKPYGAELGLGGAICRSGHASGVACVIKGKRLRFESTGTGNLLASGPISAKTVESFVERFWFWKKA